MDTPPVTLGPVEQRRLYVLTDLLAGRLTTIEAALTLDLSIRHLKRLNARYGREGIAALAHGNRGRRPWHAIDPALAGRVVELARTRYVGLNHSHLADDPRAAPEPSGSPPVAAPGRPRASASGPF